MGPRASLAAVPVPLPWGRGYSEQGHTFSVLLPRPAALDKC